MDGEGWKLGKLSSGINANTIDFHSGGETHVLFFLFSKILIERHMIFVVVLKPR